MKALAFVLLVMGLVGCSNYVSLPQVASVEDMSLTGTGMTEAGFATCVDRVFPEKNLNQKMKDRYWDNSSRISKVCRRFGHAPDYNDFEVCCQPLK